ncbi:MAG: NUDIX domain-containing protein [Propionibacteriales bacterium]|nr:NUDIX domain-containing protein [Propionibacteriales bacterium]
MTTATYLRRLILSVEPVEPDRLPGLDLYLPSGNGPWPLAVLVPGGPMPADVEPASEWPQYEGYGAALAARGVAAAVVGHPFHSLEALPKCAQVVRRGIAAARADRRIDAGRVVLWFFSGAGLLMGEWLDDRPRWLRGVAVTYPRLRAPLDSIAAPPAAVDALAGAADLPLLLTRVGRERDELAVAVEEFVAAAGAADSSLRIIDVPQGQHAFDLLDDTFRSREAVEEALTWVSGRLLDERVVQRQRLAAYALVRRPDEVLLTRLAGNTPFPGQWTLPGGGVDHGEHVQDGLARELQEETGLDIRIGALRDVHTLHHTARAPNGTLEDFHGVHLIFDGESMSADQQPRVVEIDGSTDAVAWVAVADVESGRIQVLDIVGHALG